MFPELRKLFLATNTEYFRKKDSKSLHEDVYSLLKV